MSCIRNPRYGALTAPILAQLRHIVGDAHVLTGSHDIAPYAIDWMRKFRGSPSAVVRPNSTEQVAELMRVCQKHSLAVVPQGGNTGLVGGSVPVFDELVISLGRMNRVLTLDEYAGIVTLEAGSVLEQTNTFLEERGFIFPIDLGAKGSCQIGGNISTNAGGLRYVRYGSLHGTVLGLEVVLADGTVLDLMSALRKDNTGYDLKQLFIGAEGTLGIVTKAAILVPRKPKSVQVAYLGVKNFENVLKTMQKARSELSDILSAIEFQDRRALEVVLKHMPGARDPLQESHAFYMLVETSGSVAEHDSAKLSNFLESALESELISDGTVAVTSTQQRELWQLRESVAEGLAKEGAVYKYDISLPVANMYSMVDRLQHRLGSAAKVLGYGHLGDGNLHLNCYTPKYSEDVFNKIEPWLFEQVALEKGSISAEHGMGISKNKYLHFSKSATAIQLMHHLKQMFDPKCLLNPYKVLPLNSS